ncbi:MAG: hypothetical protein WBX25_20130, partial [Rhodomicrobium sp.]
GLGLPSWLLQKSLGSKLAGWRFIPGHDARLSHLPRRSVWVSSSLIHPTVSAFPGMAAGSACTLAPVTNSRPAIRRLQPFRLLHDSHGGDVVKGLGQGSILSHLLAASSKSKV